MPFEITLDEAKAALLRAKQAVSDLQGTGRSDGATTLEPAAVGAAAFAFGYANARWGGEEGEVRVLGVPLDLGVAIAATGAALLGGLGRHAQHGVHLGSGALAAYAYRMGGRLGSASGGRAPTSVPALSAAAEALGLSAPHYQASADEWDSLGDAYTVYEDEGAINEP